MPAVTVRDVTKEFSNGAVRAVDQVTFEVEDGELLVLLGPSGCGKTSTLRMIAGLEEPDGGEITIGEVTVSSNERNLFVPAEKRNIGMVFQSYAIWPHMTVFENVAYPLRVRGTSRRLIQEQVERVLALVGLTGLEQSSSTRLSGGQQQRVALARSLVFDPRLLLLDEPLSNLDAKLRVHMRLELKKLQRQTGVTSIFVTHDQAESMALADRVIVMNQGHIEQVGAPQDIYERPRTQFVSEFVGSINLMPAMVVNAGGEGGPVRLSITDAAREITSLPGTDTALRPGQEVLVSVRPEKLHLQERAPGEQVYGWECVVESAVYYGDHREYDVAVGEQLIKVSTPTSVDLQTGGKAYLSYDPADVTLVQRAR